MGFVPLHLASELLASGELVALECLVPGEPIPVYMAWRKPQEGKALAWFVNVCEKVDWLSCRY